MNLCDIRFVKRLMQSHGTGTKKSFGQNFLINKAIPERIAEESYTYHRESEGDKPCAVLEIGPGIGSLTYELASCFDRVVAVEIDKTLIPILEETLGEFENVSVVNEDFMKLPLKDFIDEKFGEMPLSVCANLPYYITTPILMKLLEEARGRITSITVMVQREVAERIVASPGSRDYGAITASINYYGRPKRLFDVAPDNFLPSPKVTSSVVRIELYKKQEYKVKSEEMLFKVIGGAFLQRRKTLLNSLSSAFSHIPKEQIAKIIEKTGFAPDLRGERLSIEDFCRLADELIGDTVC